jgi:hypothetical protein
VTPRLEIVVDELVVRGLEPGEARVAAAALEARLTELASAGAPLHPRAEAFRRGPAVDVQAVAQPAAIGEAAASAVWSTLEGRSGR